MEILGYSIKKTGKTVVDYHLRKPSLLSAKLGLISLLFAEAVGLFFGILCAQFRGKMARLSVDGSGSFRNCPSKYGVRPDSSYDFWCKAWHPSSNRMGKTKSDYPPALVLGLGTVAGNTRNMRASMLAITTQDM
mgnify:CR=1 FL=1